MLFSIITVCLNSEKTISRTINSILDQTYNLEFEYTIIDGCSDDSTLEIIQGYKQKLIDRGVNFRLLSEKDNGIYDAMNKGIQLSEGKIIGIINSDDFYEQDALYNVALAVNLNPNIDIFYGFLRVLKSKGEEFNVYRYNYENYLTDMDCNYQAAAQHPTCFIKSDLYKKIGVYDISYKTAADYEFLLRAKLMGGSFFGINAIISNFSTGGITEQIDEYDRIEQKSRIHFKYELISEVEYKQLKRYLRILGFKKIKQIIIKFLFKL